MAGSRFVDEEELIGKTIAKVCFSDFYVTVQFTDGTYTSISYGGGYYVGESELRYDDSAQNLDDQKAPYKEI